MLSRSISTLKVQPAGGLHTERFSSHGVSLRSSFLPRPLDSILKSSQLKAVAVNGDTVPGRRTVGRPPVGDDFHGPRSRKDFRVVGDSLVEETLQKLPDKAYEGRSFQSVMEVTRFLLNLWMTKKNLLQLVQNYPEILQSDVPELEKRVDYFINGGCNAGEVGLGVVRNPHILTVPMDRLAALASYVRKTGMSEDKIPRVLLRSPGIFDVDFVKSLDPLIGSLEDLVANEGSVEKLIESQPKLLQLSDYDVAERTAVMGEFGLSHMAISNLCLKKPGVLLISPSVLRDRLLNLRTMFRERRLPNIFKVAPTLLIVSPEKINKKYELLCDYLGDDVARKVVNGFPQALSLSWKKVLLPKFEYLVELGLDPSEVVNFPAYLGYSLQDRIRPRCELLLQEGYKIEAHSQVVRSENEKKLRKHGRSHREILDTYGTHSIAIQHIVGQKDAEFEEQFGVMLSGLQLRAAAPLYEFEESDVDELEQMEQEAGLGDMDSSINDLN